jgi:hypothetical protein
MRLCFNGCSGLKLDQAGFAHLAGGLCATPEGRLRTRQGRHVPGRVGGPDLKAENAPGMGHSVRTGAWERPGNTPIFDRYSYLYNRYLTNFKNCGILGR